MKIQQIRNATLKVTYQDKLFLIDPMFAPKDSFPPFPESYTPNATWPFSNLPLSIDEIIKDVDAVIVTHYHFDHIDEYAIKVLPKDILIFVQDEYDKEILQQFGFNNIEIMSVDGTTLGNVVMYKTSCLHGDKVKSKPYYEAYKLRSNAMGVVFTGKDEQRLYLVGDTIFFDGVKEAIDKFSPYVAIINCAGAQFRESGPIIMDTDDVLALHEYQPNLRIVASHLDAVGHATVSRNDLKQFIYDKNIEDSVLIPEDGEYVEFPAYTEVMHNKAVARKLYALLNLKQYDEAAKLFHPDFVYYPQPDIKLEGVQKFMDMERANMDPCGDYKMRTKFIIAEDDRVAVYLTFEGTLLGENWLGLKANNKHMILDFMCMLRFKDGKIIEKRSKYDKYYILKKLAVDNLPPLY